MFGKDVERRTKTANIVSFIFEQKFAFGIFNSISEKIMHWHQALTIKTIQKDVEGITKSENIVTTVVEEKFAFESFEKSFYWKGILYVTLAILWIVQMRQIERKLNEIL